MPIIFNEENKTFLINTENSTYAMMIIPYDRLYHLYYGDRVNDSEDLAYLRNNAGAGRDSSYPEVTYDDYENVGVGKFGPWAMRHEYSTYGLGDFRTAALSPEFANGSRNASLVYEKHRIISGKPALEGLPSVYVNEGEKAETLIITLKDTVYNFSVDLYYSIIEGHDQIMRHAEIKNNTGAPVFLNSAYSACVDFATSEYDIITFHGRPTNERFVDRAPLRAGKVAIESTAGATGHFNNNSLILCDRNADETVGACYGATMVYSGSYALSAEVDHIGRTRVLLGINPSTFRWKLSDGETFVTPEIIFNYSNEGLGGLSQGFHDLIRYNVCRGKYKDSRRPVLTNNWEATVFEFDEDKLVSIAEDAKQFGVEMLVVDDGWFGHRDWDNSSLGDWFEDKNKLPNGIKGLCKRLNDIGMDLGVWFEPEMISEDSELYRNHPDYCIKVPDRDPMKGRWQLVLDMSRKDVRDTIYDMMYKILSESPVKYIKWDMNRNITDAYSLALEADRQGEFHHRFTLGVYELMERFNRDFPDLLIETCCGGGGRFDCGMLYYGPQIWCSDQTDPAHRMHIQYGTSLIYPVSTMGAHVAYAPNINTFHPCSVFTRGVAAMAGTFGYELDPNIESDYNKGEMAIMTELYKKHYFTINHGDYYRLISPYEKKNDITRLSCWEFVSKDKEKALFNFVQMDNVNAGTDIYVKLRGLDKDKKYNLHMYYETRDDKVKPFTPWIEQKDMGVFSGDVLMKAGVHFNLFRGDNMACLIEIDAI